MNQVKSIEWVWNHGKTFTKIIYDDDRIDPRQNDEPPPTHAMHDIAHFICAFHENLTWDYIPMPNHIAEFNAVFVENLLGYFAEYYFHGKEINIDEASDIITKQMKWFAHDYYKIHIDHPSRKNYSQLRNDFFKYVDLNILVHHFNSFYQTFLLQRLMKSDKFDLSLKMDRSDKFEFDPLRTYLNNISEQLIHKGN